MASAPTLELRDHFCHYGRPSRLVTRADSSAAASMEVFIEEEEITPLRIVLKQLHITVEGSSSVAITSEDADQTFLQLQRDLPEIELSTRSSREFHLEIITEVPAELLQGFDE